MPIRFMVGEHEEIHEDTQALNPRIVGGERARWYGNDYMGGYDICEVDTDDPAQIKIICEYSNGDQVVYYAEKVTKMRDGDAWYDYVTLWAPTEWSEENVSECGDREADCA